MKRARLDLLRHPVSFVGVSLATVFGLLIALFFVASLLGASWGGPYGGVVAYVLFPALLLLGLALIPLGLWLGRRQRARAAAGEPEPRLPVLDFNRPSMRRLGLGFVVLTAVNLVLVGAATYKGLEVMDSTAFCGSCHSVMDPEATAHAHSPHARVPCVACHIGPGASWFVKSKLSGSWQVVSVAFDLYPRPIPVPVHDLRPARDTCEQCHWPSKFVGDRLKVITRHADDATSSPTKTVILVHVGGSQGVRSRGIHWHVDRGVRLRYLAGPQRDLISEVELDETGQELRRFAGKEPAPAGAAWREMDCVDCHNRPSHIFRSPEEEVDGALEAGRLDAKLPFLRREGVKVLKTAYGSADAARAGIAERLTAFYAGQGRTDPAAIGAASRELGDIWARNVWPHMRIGWGTYPSFLGHEAAPGCFRCHDGEHVTKDGTAIRNDCNLCHDLLAQDEKEPAVLKALMP